MIRLRIADCNLQLKTDIRFLDLQEEVNDDKSGWTAIGKYIGKAGETAERYARKGMPVFRDPGGRPMAIKEQIDKYLLELNREKNAEGVWEGHGIEKAIEMSYEQEQSEKEFEERLINAQRANRSRF